MKLYNLSRYNEISFIITKLDSMETLTKKKNRNIQLFKNKPTLIYAFK